MPRQALLDVDRNVSQLDGYGNELFIARAPCHADTDQ